VEFIPRDRDSPSRIFPMRIAVLAVTAGLLSFSTSGLAQNFSACDLNQDGVVNSADVGLAVSMMLNPATCTANIIGPGVCNVVVLQRVVNAGVPGGTCVVSNSHWVLLTWTASTTPSVNYNIYRGTSIGAYMKLNSTPVSATSYTDSTVQSGQTYYYVATAVDASGNESSYSAPPAQAVVPSP
jgi:hypothetical protein